MMRNSLFLSHSSKDKPFVLILANHLRNRGVSVWVDETELKVGDRLSQTIRQAIQEGHYLGLVLSSHSVRSDWVRRELNMAMETKDTPHPVSIAPIMLEQVDMPAELEDRVYADFTDEDNYHLAFHKLLQLLGHRTPPSDRLVVYEDELALGWENWSWKCTCDDQATDYVHSGRYAMSVQLRGFGGLAVAFRSGVDTSGFKELEFYVNGGKEGGQVVEVFCNVTLGDGVKPPVPLAPLTREQWQQVRVTLEDLGVKDTIIVKVNLHDNSGHDQPTFFVDDISFVA